MSAPGQSTTAPTLLSSAQYPTAEASAECIPSRFQRIMALEGPARWPYRERTLSRAFVRGTGTDRCSRALACDSAAHRGRACESEAAAQLRRTRSPKAESRGLSLTLLPTRASRTLAEPSPSSRVSSLRAIADMGAQRAHLRARFADIARPDIDDGTLHFDTA